MATKQVRWNHSLSRSFSVSNGVRQGDVLSPVVYIDDLLVGLERLGICLHWNLSLQVRFAMRMISFY